MATTKGNYGKTKYICSECGYNSQKWLGKCPNCDSWGTFEEEVDIKRTLKNIQSEEVSISKISEIEIAKEFRMVTQYEEFDRVLGGGAVKRSAVLIGGEPGIGKSTLLLQAAAAAAAGAVGQRTLYVSGEESAGQIRGRADRLGIPLKNIELLCTNSVENIEKVFYHISIAEKGIGTNQRKFHRLALPADQ